MSKATDLSAYLFEGRPHWLGSELTTWMDASTRFTGFVETYRDKIRKKIRAAHGADSLLDVRSELRTAARLLDDRRFTLVYEPYASEKQRGADFAVTYRANLMFNIEVSRIHAETAADDPRDAWRFVRVLLGKLGQMQAGMPNLLVIHAGESLAEAVDLAALMQAIKLRVEQKQGDFLAAIGYASTAAFYRDFLRLNGVVIWSANDGQAWMNKSARPSLDEKIIARIAGFSAAGK